MLRTAAAIILCLLPSEVYAITALAKCLSGFEWMFSSTNQSPCDVSAELATVCYSTTFQVYPLSPGYYYHGPYLGYDNDCICNSVYYSLLSACAFCQGQGILLWSLHSANCTSRMIHLAAYPQQIPVGVKVPAYAYQDVSISDRFVVSVAYNVKGTESSRPVPSSTETPTSSSTVSATTTTAASVSKPPSPAVIGGVVVGGVVGIGLVTALITFLVLRSKQKSQKHAQDTSIQQNRDMAFSPDTATSLHSGKFYNTYNFADPNTSDRPNSPPLNLNSTPHFTGNDSTQNHAHTFGRYSGMPEF